MPRGGEQILLSPGRNIDRNLPRESNYDNIRGEIICVTILSKLFLVVYL